MMELCGEGETSQQPTPVEVVGRTEEPETGVEDLADSCKVAHNSIKVGAPEVKTRVNIRIPQTYDTRSLQLAASDREAHAGSELAR